MAQLAIKGHFTRGKEVIQFLEMLGGVNYYNLNGIVDGYYYYIDENSNKIYHCLSINPKYGIVSTIEEFEKKFPYKVGDKVYNIIHNENQTITEVAWDFQENVVVYQTNNNEYLFVNYLQPYKKQESVASNTEIGKGAEYENIKVSYLSINDKEYADEIEINLGDDYEYKFEMNRLYILKKKPKYPKDYEECCRIIDYHLTGPTIIGYKKPLLENLQQLLICRDAYWKIAGAEMGLDKPWKPDWSNDGETKFCIYTTQNMISLDIFGVDNRILAFPTEEMRDAFFDNFKDLIENVKELL